MNAETTSKLCQIIAAGLLTAATFAAAATAQTPPKNFALSDQPKAVADLSFANESGQAVGLHDFKDKFVVLNIWATWCVPCRQEMPALTGRRQLRGHAGLD
jgi:thiol-disulfide isomerase/thioredoxin